MLAHLSRQANRPNYRFKRLFRNLYNPLFYEQLSTEASTIIRLLQSHKVQPCQYQYAEILAQLIERILSAIYPGVAKQTTLHEDIIMPFLHDTWLFSCQIERVNSHLTLNFLKDRIADEKFLTLVYELKEIGYLQPLLLKIAYLHVDKRIEQTFPQLTHARIAHHFLFGMRCSKQNSLLYLKELNTMLEDTFGLQLHARGKSIYHRKESIPFCQYNLQLNGSVAFFIERKELLKRLCASRVIRLGREGEVVTIHRSYLLHLKECEILAIYKRDYQRLMHRYRYASNRGLLRLSHHYLRESMLKTLAYKYRTTLKKIAKSWRECRLY